jgi:uncharacterized protein YjbI with pentapeptide repeats
MGRCSYTWEGRDEEKDGYVEKRCQKDTWKGSDEYCIFHDPSLGKDVDLFKEKLEEQMHSETERHNFSGYYFPKNWDFSGKKFEIDTDFKRATFQGTADFRKATFQDSANFSDADFQDAIFNRATFQDTANFGRATFQDAANFSDATFQGTADFSGITSKMYIGRVPYYGVEYFKETVFQGKAMFFRSTFKGTAYFNRANFQDAASFSHADFQDAIFNRATFHDVAFKGSIFHKKADLTPKNVEKFDLRYSEFLDKSYITSDLRKTLFYRSFIENVAFIDCKWPDDYIIYEERHTKDEDIILTFNQLETIYRDLKQNMQNHGDYITAGELYYREMEMKRKGAPIKNRIWLEVYRLSAGYGECPQNTVVVSASIVFLFAFLYGASNCLQYSMTNPCIQQRIIDVTYFSFVTFTTLGLGDIAPATTLGKILICVEAVIGAFMIALFVVVSVRKMAR